MSNKNNFIKEENYTLFGMVHLHVGKRNGIWINYKCFGLLGRIRTLSIVIIRTVFFCKGINFWILCYILDVDWFIIMIFAGTSMFPL